jgi:hypothetical protein
MYRRHGAWYMSSILEVKVCHLAETVSGLSIFPRIQSPLFVREGDFWPANQEDRISYLARDINQPAIYQERGVGHLV